MRITAYFSGLASMCVAITEFKAQPLPTCQRGGYMTCDFQKCGILTSVDTDEPVQPLFLSLEAPYVA